MPDPIPQMLRSKKFKSVTGGVTVSITNPLRASFIGLPPKGTTLNGENGQPLTGSNLVLSIAPDGTPQVRPTGTAGPWEVARKQNGLLVFDGNGEEGDGGVLPYAD